MSITIDSNSKFDVVNSQLEDIIVQAYRSKDDLQQKRNIDRVINKYLDTEGDDSRNCLIQLCAIFHSVRNLKKYLCEKLHKRTSYSGLNIFENIIVKTVSGIITDIQVHKILSTRNCLEVLNFVYTYMQTFTRSQQYGFVIDEVFPFYQHILQVYVHDILDSGTNTHLLNDTGINSILTYTLQHKLLVLTKAKDLSFEKYSLEFVKIYHHILKDSKLKFDILSKCGLILAHFLNYLPREETHSLKWRNLPILDSIDNPQNDFCIVLQTMNIDQIFINDKMKIILFCSIVNSLDPNIVKNTKLENGTILQTFLLLELLTLAKKVTGCPSQILLISRTITAMSENLNESVVFGQVFEESLAFVWSHLDHFVESVCHHTRAFFSKLIRLSFTFDKEGDSKFLQSLTEIVSSMSTTSYVRLNALEIMCERESSYWLENFEGLKTYLLDIIVVDEQMALKAGNVYTSLMESQSLRLGDEDFMTFWITPVLTKLKTRQDESLQSLEKLITQGFKSKPSIFKYLSLSSKVGNTVEYMILLKCIHFARNKGVELPLQEDNGKQLWRGLIPKRDMELLMCHQDEEVRILILQIVTECQKTTEEMTEWEMSFLLNYLTYNAAAQIPSCRKKIESLFKKIFLRYQASYKVLLRNSANFENLTANFENSNATHQDDFEMNQRKVKKYQSFLLNMMRILLNNLAPDANYSRRSLSLELLIALKDIATDRDWTKGFSQDHVKYLKNILHDSYESNKAMALSLLESLPSKDIGFEDEESTLDYFNTSLTLITDIRPSKSLSASYMLQLCLASPFPSKVQQLSKSSKNKNFRLDVLFILIDKLNSMIDFNKENILQATQSAPVHAVLLGIKNLLQSREIRRDDQHFSEAFHQLVTICMHIKNHVLPVVCSPSPEGFIPENDVLLEVDETSKAQMVLVFSWRTIKEIMALFSELVRQTVHLEDTVTMLAEEELCKIGQFFIDLFLHSRHRGVFEQAHVFFSPVCHNFWRSGNKVIQMLPSKWLNETLALCTGQKSNNDLCSTRRSAGLPFLILSVISTAPDTHSDCFYKSIEELLQTAGNTEDSHEEYQMHCLNVLRFIFIHAKLGESVATYVGRAVIVALRGFKSRTWRVRNSSTLLFSALMTRMFGVQRTQDSDNVSSKNKLTFAVFSVRYPELIEFLLESLTEECGNTESLLLHPMLLILARLFPSHTDKISQQVQDYIPCLNKCISNPTYTTRNLAARASVCLIPFNKYSAQLTENLNKIANMPVTDNECHGLLLQMHYLLTSHSFSQEMPISKEVRSTLHLLHHVGIYFSHFTVSLYMKVLFELVTRFQIDLCTLKEIVRSLNKSKKKNGEINTSESDYTWNRLQVLLAIFLNKFEITTDTYTIVVKHLFESIDSKNPKLVQNCLDFLIYLHDSDSNLEKHPLFISGDMETTDSTQKLIDSLDENTKKQLILNIHRHTKDFLMKQFRKCQNSPHTAHILILLRHYPCVFKTMLENGCPLEELMEFLVDLCSSRDGYIHSASISCVSNLLFVAAVSSKNDMKEVDYVGLFEVLSRSASPAAADFLRLTVAQCLADIRDLIHTNYFEDCDTLRSALNIMMVLLEDEELVIRKAMSNFFSLPVNKGRDWNITPERARLELMSLCTKLLPKEMSIGFLLSWCLRYMPENSPDTSEVYERGELNLFAENIPIISSASAVFRQLLWDELGGNDKESLDQGVISSVTSLLINCLSEYSLPMVPNRLKRKVIGNFKAILNFTQNHSGDDFTPNFRTFFSGQIVNFSNPDNFNDDFNIRSTLLVLYNPILDDFNIDYK